MSQNSCHSELTFQDLEELTNDYTSTKQEDLLRFMLQSDTLQEFTFQLEKSHDKLLVLADRVEKAKCMQDELIKLIEDLGKAQEILKEKVTLLEDKEENNYDGYYDDYTDDLWYAVEINAAINNFYECLEHVHIPERPTMMLERKVECHLTQMEICEHHIKELERGIKSGQVLKHFLEKGAKCCNFSTCQSR